ncbi:MAG: hypothetical protein OXG84_18380, partial [Chloroflexi bacterium]|nr:hypothetical protein [Chloroflexota bacterium]
ISLANGSRTTNEDAASISASEQKSQTDLDSLRTLNPAKTRQLLGDGNMGGLYQRADEEMLEIWQVAVAETLALLEGGWD